MPAGVGGAPPHSARGSSHGEGSLLQTARGSPAALAESRKAGQSAGGYPAAATPPSARSSSRGASAAGGGAAGSRNSGGGIKVDLVGILVGEVRKLVLQQGGTHGVNSLSRVLRATDASRNGPISAAELELGFNRFGLQMDRDDVKMLLKAVDKAGGGKNLTVNQFIAAFRGDVSSARVRAIDAAFDFLDRPRSGCIEAHDIQRLYDGKHHPEVLAGRLLSSQATTDFLSHFNVDQNGAISRKDFIEYYKNVSSSIDNDEYFEMMLRGAWRLPGASGWTEDTVKKRILVTHVDNQQEVVNLQCRGSLDIRDHAAVIRQLEKQGIIKVRTFRLYQ